MHDDEINEIVALVDDPNEWVGEDDFGLSVAALPMADLPAHLAEYVRARPEHDMVLITWHNTGARQVESGTAHWVYTIMRNTELEYLRWLDEDAKAKGE